MNKSPSSAVMIEDALPGALPLAVASAQPADPATAMWPLSPTQAGMWSEHQLSRGLPVYNMYSAVRLLGQLDVDALRMSIRDVVARHETLRTRIVLLEGRPMQAVDALDDVALPITDLLNCNVEQREQALCERIEAAARHAFDLERGPLFLSELLRFGAGEHVLLSNLHHVVADGWSNMVLVREVAACYDARVRGGVAGLVPLAIQYGRYCETLQQRPRTRGMSRQLEFWEQRLRDLDPVLSLNAQSQRPAIKTYDALTESCQIPAALLAGLKAVAQAQKCSLFMVLLAAFKMLAARYAARTDIAVATPTANRNQVELTDVIGLFANTLILRTNLTNANTFAQALQRIKEGCALAFRHQEVPLHDIVEVIKPARDAGQLPFTQVFFVLHNVPDASVSMGDLQLESMHLDRRLSAYDLQVELFRDGDGLRIHFTANCELYARSFVRQMMDHYVDVIRQMTLDATQRWDTLELDQRPRPGALVPSAVHMNAAFEAACKSSPSHSALVAAQRAVTYAELQERVSALAQDLSHALSDRTIVGLCADDPVELAVGMLAVLRSGHVCLPLSSSAVRDARHASHLLSFNPGAFESESLACGWQLSGASANPSSILLRSDAALLFGDAGEIVALNEQQVAAEVDEIARSLSLKNHGTLLQIGKLSAASAIRNLALSWRSGGCVRVVTADEALPRDADLVCIDMHCAAKWLKRESLAASIDVLCTDGPLNMLPAAGIDAKQQRLFYSPGLPQLFGMGAQLLSTGEIRGQRCVKRALSATTEVLNALLHAAPSGTAGRLFHAVPDGVTSNVSVTAANGSLFVDTGLYGIRDGDALLVDHDDLSPWIWRDGQRARLSDTERAIRTLDRVEDCVARQRQRSNGEIAVVAYIVHAATVSLEVLITQAAARVSRLLLPDVFVAIASVPLRSDGNIDERALAAVPIIDAELLNHCEVQGRALAGAIDAAAIIEQATATQKILHWSDLCPAGIAAPGNEATATQIVAQRDAALTASTTPAHSVGPELPQEDGVPSVLAELIIAVGREGTKGIVYLDENAAERSESYREVLDQARRIQSGLMRSGMKPGDILLYQLADNRDFLHAFWACTLGGFVPVPIEGVPDYAEAGARRDKLVNVWESLKRPRVISDRARASQIRSIKVAGEGGFEVLAIESLRDYSPATEQHVAQPDDLALLLLTSGSTGTPKAVMQTHRALIARCRATAINLGLDDQGVGFNWMPMEHVAALVMFHVMDVFRRAPQVHAATTTVLADPMRWLEWLTRYRAVVTWAPNFAYALIGERLAKEPARNFDLSSVRCMMNAGEVVVAATCRKFLSLLAPYGLAPNAVQPAWGMSETCSTVTCNSAFAVASTSDADLFVSNGRPFPGCEMRIVDAQDQVIGESSVGRIQVRGLMVTRGYYANPAATASSFTADGWFKTGDLGYLANGELYITGREKDTIIINGVNYYPHEIEAVVDRVESVLVSSAAACALRKEGSQTDQLAVFFTPIEAHGKPLAELIGAVRTAILTQVGLSAAHIIPVSIDQIPKTSIGKIQRSALVKRFEAGEFAAALKRVDLELKSANTLEECYFARQWRAKAIRDRDDSRCPRGILIFDDGSGLGIELSQRPLEKFSVPVILVRAATEYRRDTATAYSVNPQRDEDYARVLEQVRADGVSVDEVLHLWTLTGERRMRDLTTLRGAQQLGVLSVLRLVQSLQRVYGDSQPMRLRVVSALTQGVTGDREIAAAHGALFGLIHTINHEAPWLNASHIDLDDSPPTVRAGQIGAEILRAGVDTEVAYRDGVRLTPALVRVDVTAGRSDTPALVRGGMYLIAGGLGGIGEHVVDMLLRQFDAKVIVVGRSPLPLDEEPIEGKHSDSVVTRLRSFAHLKARAAGRIAYECADVRDPDALEQIVARWERHWAQPLAGMLHLATAGSVAEHWSQPEQHRIASMTPQAFEAAIGPKVYGTWSLRELALRRPRATMISFSSVNALFGGNLLGAYSAACSFQQRANWSMRHLDQLDCYCLLWTMWQDLGMSQGMPEFATHASRALGYRTLSIRQGLWSLLGLLRKAPGEWIAGLNPQSTLVRTRLVTKEISKHVALFVAQDERRASAATMPDQMTVRDLTGTPVRAKVVSIDRIPKRADGAPDRELLSARSSTDARAVSGDPRNEEQRKLLQIWRDVLGKQALGVHDNFFDLGGDSILAIQVVARANRFGWQLSTRSVFEHQTIATLSAAIEQSSEPLIVRSPYTGEVPLAPVQLWFLEQLFHRPDHWNQSVLLEVHGRLDETAARAALDAVLAHHDILRMRMQPGAEPPVALVDAHIDGVPFECVEIAEASSPALQNEATRVQAALDLQHGPLLRAAWFDCGAEASGYLLLAAHHMVVDGVSWRILIENFLAGYEQALRGELAELPPRTAHYAEWSAALRDLARSQEFRADAQYWLEMPRTGFADLGVTRGDAGCIGNEAVESFALDSQATSALLQHSSGVGDVLLASLLLAFRESHGASRLLLTMEGHGREGVVDDLDLSLTVGWFTSIYPLVLEAPAEATASQALAAVRQQLRKVPKRGFSFGVMRYLSDDEALRTLLASLPRPKISLNYLGQFDGSLAGQSRFSFADIPAGRMQDAGEKRVHELDIVAYVVDGVMRFNWSYDGSAGVEPAIQAVVAAFRRALGDFLENAENQVALVPSDFPLVTINDAQLAAIVDDAARQGAQIEQIWPATSTQQGLLFHTLSDPTSGVYVSQLINAIRGDLNTAALRSAWQAAVDRNEIYRTGFHGLDSGLPLQVVLKSVRLPWTELDWSDLPVPEQELRLQQLLTEDRQRGFEVGSVPLMRVAVVRLERDVQHLILTEHHAITDGWSRALILKDVFEVYGALVAERSLSMPPRPSYAGYVRWLQNKSVVDAEHYWRALLSGFQTPTPLFDSRLPSSGSKRSETHHVTRRVDSHIGRRLRLSARRHEVTLSTLLHGAWAVLLSHNCDQSEVLFGATDSGRSPSLPGVHDMTGLFINNLPVRVRVDGDQALGAWLKSLQRQQLESAERAYVSMREIQSWSEIASPLPLFESVVVVENYPSAAASSAHAVTLEWADSVDQSHFPMMLVIEAKDEVVVRAYFDPARVSSADVTQMIERYEVVLQSMADEASKRLLDLQVLTLAERELVTSLNATTKAFDSYHCMQECLTQQAAQTPEAPAVIAWDRSLSYGALFQEAIALSRLLRDAGAVRNELIAVLLDKGWEQVVAVYGILFAGAAYLPIDPKWPEARQQQVIESSRAKMVVTSAGTELPSWARSMPVFLIEEHARVTHDTAVLAPPRYQTPDDVAYVIFTSGSTGTPKGVTIRHSAAMNTLLDINDRFAVTRNDRVLGLSSLTFDLSVYDIFGLVAAGGTLVLPSPQQEKDPAAWADLIQRHGITIWDTVPAMMQMLVDHLDEHPAALKLPRIIMMSGDWIPLRLPGRIRAHSPNSRIISLGGATEASIWSIAYEIGALDPNWSSVPYGRPLANQSFQVLNRDLQPCPVAVAGDLCIGGVGLADGYWLDPERTAKQFLVHPLSAQRLYRTGDRGRLHADGYIEFLGRVDAQVKVHGYRVDLSEIENVLIEQASVKDAVVGIKQSDDGGRHLVAYVVPASVGTMDFVSLRQQLATRLPQYMVPWQYVQIDSVPLTSNGKVDRGRLPDVAVERSAVPTRATRNMTEEVLAAIWTDVLNIADLTPVDNFFECGGHSLMATQVIARIRKTFGTDLPIRALFEAPTIRQLAIRVNENRASSVTPREPLQASASNYVEASSSQKRSWLVEHLQEGTTTLNIATRLLLRGAVDSTALGCSVQELVRRHASLRTTFIEDDGVLMQAVAEDLLSAFRVVDLPETQALEDSVRQARRAFDLDHGPLLRVILYRLAPERHLLLAAFHHIIFDGWSMAVFMDELVNVYDVLARGDTPSLAPLGLQYKDFSEWQRGWLQSAECERQVAYWRESLAGLPATSTFPANRPRPSLSTGIGADVVFEVEPALTAAISELSRREAMTPYVVYMAVLAVLLSEQAEQQDLAIGATIANRRFAEVEGVIGFFANQVAIRSHIDEQLSFGEFLTATRAVVLAAYDHQDVPFERLVEALGRAGALSHTPLFQVKLVLQNAPVAIGNATGLRTQPLALDLGGAKFDLQITMEEHANGLNAVATYSVDLYEEAYVRCLVADFKFLLAEGTAAPAQTLAELMNRMRAARKGRLRPASSSLHAAVPMGVARAVQASSVDEAP